MSLLENVRFAPTYVTNPELKGVHGIVRAINNGMVVVSPAGLEGAESAIALDGDAASVAIYNYLCEKELNILPTHLPMDESRGVTYFPECRAVINNDVAQKTSGNTVIFHLAYPNNQDITTEIDPENDPLTNALSSVLDLVKNNNTGIKRDIAFSFGLSLYPMIKDIEKDVTFYAQQVTTRFMNCLQASLARFKNEKEAEAFAKRIVLCPGTELEHNSLKGYVDMDGKGLSEVGLDQLKRLERSESAARPAADAADNFDFRFVGKSKAVGSGNRVNPFDSTRETNTEETGVAGGRNTARFAWDESDVDAPQKEQAPRTTVQSRGIFSRLFSCFGKGAQTDGRG